MFRRLGIEAKPGAKIPKVIVRLVSRYVMPGIRTSQFVIFLRALGMLWRCSGRGYGLRTGAEPIGGQKHHEQRRTHEDTGRDEKSRIVVAKGLPAPGKAYNAES